MSESAFSEKPLPKSAMRFLMVLVVLSIVTGIFFRFYGLGYKIYWLDESHTSLRIFGFTEREFISDFFNGAVVHVKDLFRYQMLSPEKGWDDTLRALMGNSEHAPLYYLLARLWATLWGSSVASIRSLSTVTSLLGLPAIFWLCWELFHSKTTSWIAVALLAVSPFYTHYAQDARPYSLLMLMVLSSSAALLSALGWQKNINWMVYGLFIILGCYTHWLFSCVIVSHVLYVLVSEKFRVISKRCLSFGATTLVAVVAFLPWIYMGAIAPPALKEQMAWIYQSVPWTELVRAWLIHTSRLFFDLDIGQCIKDSQELCKYPLSFESPIALLWQCLLLGLVIYSAYLLFKYGPHQAWLWVVSLFLISAAAVTLPDLISGGQRSTVSRYVIPALVAIQITVAYGLSHQIRYSQRRGVWKSITTGIIMSGMISQAALSQMSGSWVKGGNYHIQPIADMLNQQTAPLILYSLPEGITWGKGGTVGRVMPLVRRLNPDTEILFLEGNDMPKELARAPNTHEQPIFWYRPPEDLIQVLQNEHSLTIKPVFLHPINHRPWVWQIES